MEMLEIHEEALSHVLPVFHEFLGRYDVTARRVYGFVEGKDDPSFYRGIIENMLPNEWNIDLSAVGNKDNVIKLFHEFNWNRFEKKQIVFFIDRDLSDIISEALPNSDNIYITDNYSIENDIVSRETCERILTETCNMSSLEGSQMKIYLDMFDTQLGIFKENIILIMVWYIYLKRNNHKPSFSDVLMKHLFNVNDGVLVPIKYPKRRAGLEEYIHEQWNIRYRKEVDLDSTLTEFRTVLKNRDIVRGKYELWFLVKFVLSVRSSVESDSSLSIPKMRVTLSPSNAMVIIAPMARIPVSLRYFLENTCIKFVRPGKIARQMQLLLEKCRILGIKIWDRLTA